MAHRLRVLIAATLVAVATRLILAQQAQAPPPTFRSAIEAVQIDVIVTDAAGNPVRGLTVDDFELFENRKPQPITTFNAVDIPIERAESIERSFAEPDVLTNDTPPGRVYLFALDEVQKENILRTRRFVRQFIEDHFGPRDIGAIALLGRGLATEGQDFTTNRRLLLNAVDKFSGGFPGDTAGGESQSRQANLNCDAGGLMPVGAGNGLTARDAPVSLLASPRALGRSQQSTSLRSLTELMARIPGRHKAMIVFTECLDIDAEDIVDYNGGVLSIAGEDLHAAMAAATRSNLAIYPIDPTGLDSFVTIPLETIGALRSLGEATGGFALVNSNSFTEAFERIVRENSTYYMLAFNSGYTKEDGKYVRMEVRVKRPGLTVHAREGYVAPTRYLRRTEEVARGRSATSAVSTALASPLATSGIPMRVFAVPFKGKGRNATVALTTEFEAAALGLKDQGGAITGTFDVRYLATDATRKIWPAVAHTASVDVKPSSRDRVPLDRLRVRVVSELELPKGRYQVRIAAGSGIVAGNVVYDLEIPDFSDGPLTMSGMALVSRSEPTVLTLRSERGRGNAKPMKCYSELCAPPVIATGAAAPATGAAATGWLDGRLPGPPTTMREFTQQDEAVLVAEVYDNTKPGKTAPPSTITVAIDLLTRDGMVLPLASERRLATAPRHAFGGHTIEIPLRFRDVPEGAYALRVQARSSSDDRHVVTREIPIGVRPAPGAKKPLP